MAHVLAQTRLDSMFDNRTATGGGLLGMVACCGLLAATLFGVGRGPSDEDPSELEFVPGMVMALGSTDAPSVTTPAVVEPAEPTPQTPTEPTPEEPTPESDEPADEPVVEDAVTEDVTPPRPPRTPRPPRPPRPPSNANPDDSRLPPPPSTPPSLGDPIGDPGGFDQLNKSGDAWARGVIAALDAMDVGTVYAKPIAGTVIFEMTICKDGTVSRVSSKGGTASVDERDLVLLEVERLKIPRPPAHVASKMNKPCVKLKHRFRWTSKGTR